MIRDGRQILVMAGLILLLSILGLLLAGCGASGRASPAPAPSADAALTSALIAAAERATAALEQLAEAEAEAARAAGTPDRTGEVVPAELLRPVTLHWLGPLDAAAALLAREAGYGFSVAGRADQPVLIELQADAVPLIDVLRMAGLQAGDRADLRVTPSERRIEVIHVRQAGRR